MTEQILRPYQATHPFLTFKIDLRTASPRFWMFLGEVRSKCEHISQVPLREDTAAEMYSIYFAKGVNATTAIEGNSLTEQEVRARLDGELELPPSKEYMGVEIDNMIEAYQRILDDCRHGVVNSLTPDVIKDSNRLILKGLDNALHVRPGEIRLTNVSVGPYLAPPAEDCDYLLERLCHFLDKDFKCDPKDRVVYGFIKAAIAHLYLAWIHPFGDGNGRTARLAEFQILVNAGVPVPAAHVLTSHYNDTRTQYYRQLDLATKSGGNVLPFLEYSVEGFVDGLRSQLTHIHAQQHDLAWKDFVDQRFRDKTGPTGHRQRLLLLALSAAGPSPKASLRRLSPETAEAYASKTSKTLSRDVNALTAMGLVVRTPDGRYRAVKEHIQFMLPPRARA